MSKPTEQQQIDWVKAGRCHVCGSDVDHSHPNWMWLANPIPDVPEQKERVDIERKRNELTLKNIVGADISIKTMS